VFFDIDEIAGHGEPAAPHAAGAESFRARGAARAGRRNKIVVYDTTPKLGARACVDVPRHGPQGRRGARRRPAQVDEGKPPARRRSVRACVDMAFTSSTERTSVLSIRA